MKTRGWFLALEGGEGAGKSTVARALATRIESSGREVVVTREPGGTPVAEAIRTILLSPELPDAAAWSEALLFAAARADHVQTLIRPALQRGAVVISDRFVDSSVAYQGVGRGLGAAAVRRANDAAVADCAPDLTVVLDIDPAVGLARAVGANRMEARSMAFHRAVRTAFLEFAAEDPQRYRVVDAGRPTHDVVSAVIQWYDDAVQGADR